MPDTRHGRVLPARGFKPARWLPGPHLPTLWAALCRPVQAPALCHERLELADGDFLDLASTPDNGGPLVLLLHGLEGSHRSSYARAMLAALHAAGYRGVLMHFRGCSGEPNRLPRSYHSGDTGDAASVVAHLRARHGAPPFAAIGYSLGGNVLLKWLGECGADAPFTTAVAVSVPFDLAACADRLAQGASRLYQWHLVRSMQARFTAKFGKGANPLDITDIRALDSFWRFDDAVTAPLHGFRDVHDYYARASCRPWLARIAIPTLIVHAEDDPFVPAHAIPRAAELAPEVSLELSASGGHVGFVAGAVPGFARYWLEERIVAHLDLLRPRSASGDAGYNAHGS